MGCAQMEQLDDFIAAKRRIAQRYGEALATVPGLQLPQEADWAFSTCWMYTILVDKAKVGVDSRQLLKHLHESKIQTRPLWQPLHLSPAHDSPGVKSCPTSETLYRDALSLPCSVGLSQTDQDRVIELITDKFGRMP